MFLISFSKNSSICFLNISNRVFKCVQVSITFLVSKVAFGQSVCRCSDWATCRKEGFRNWRPTKSSLSNRPFSIFSSRDCRDWERVFSWDVFRVRGFRSFLRSIPETRVLRPTKNTIIEEENNLKILNKISTRHCSATLNLGGISTIFLIK